MDPGGRTPTASINQATRAPRGRGLLDPMERMLGASNLALRRGVPDWFRVKCSKEPRQPVQRVVMISCEQARERCAGRR